MKKYALALLVLTGCATSPIVDVANDDSVSVRYDPALVSPASAAQTAEAHCRDIGRDPVLMTRGKEGAWRTLTYHCVKP